MIKFGQTRLTQVSDVEKLTGEEEEARVETRHIQDPAPAVAG